MESDDIERSLLTRWQAGDRGAGDKLLRRYMPLLHRFFSSRVSTDVVELDVEELVARTLLACVQNVNRFEGKSTFRSYLLAIARRELLVSIRAQLKETKKVQEPQRRRPNLTSRSGRNSSHLKLYFDLDTISESDAAAVIHALSEFVDEELEIVGNKVLPPSGGSSWGERSDEHTSAPAGPSKSVSL